MNVLKNAQNPLYFHTSEMLDIVISCMHGSDYYLSTHFTGTGLKFQEKELAIDPLGRELLFSFCTTQSGLSQAAKGNKVVFTKL